MSHHRGRGGRGGGGGFNWQQFRDRGRNQQPEQQYRQRSPSSQAQSQSPLANFFRRVDGGNYPMLKDLLHQTFQLPSSQSNNKNDFVADIRATSIQPDPYAPGSQFLIRVRMNMSSSPSSSSSSTNSMSTTTTSFSSWPQEFFTDEQSRIAMEDLLLRDLNEHLFSPSYDNHNNEQQQQQRHPLSASIEIQKPSQHILKRTAIVLTTQTQTQTQQQQPQQGDRNDNYCYAEIRARVPLPGNGRRIAGDRCYQIFFDCLLPALEKTFSTTTSEPSSKSKIQRYRDHIISFKDQEFVRNEILPRLGLSAFVADGSVLPRRSGSDDRPMNNLQKLVPFKSPPTLSISIDLPFSNRRISGMGLKKGIIAISGGGFQGKSCLIRSLDVGVYSKVPGDGREFVITDPSAVKIRAEDRRSIAGVDISPFIAPIAGQPTSFFSTPDASGSTSQAANIVEAVESGSRLLLIDEDTSATNFLMRDPLMEELIEKEPICPFSERVKDLYENCGISTIIVCGGSSAMLKSAQAVIVMQDYHCVDKTELAKKILENRNNSKTLSRTAQRRTREGDDSTDENTDKIDRDHRHQQQHRHHHPELTAETILGKQRYFDLANTFQSLSKTDDGGSGSGDHNNNNSRLMFSEKGIDHIMCGAVASNPQDRLNQHKIDLAMIEQLVEKGQVAAISVCLANLCLKYLQGAGSNNNNSNTSMSLLVSSDQILQDIDSLLAETRRNPDFSSVYTHKLPRGFLAAPRKIEVMAAFSRMRFLKAAVKK